MQSGDTIVAISSAAAPAARMIVRASGPGARRLGAEITSASGPAPGAAQQTMVHLRGMQVPAWMFFFASPRSYTGEDIVEFHVPGNPLLARMLLETIVKLGARQAEPGEFTARGYFNGRTDLAKAEGVAATIAASSERELRAARQLLAGELARRLKPVMDSLADSLALVEVGIDFVEEDVSFISIEELRRRVDQCDASLRALLEGSTRLETLCHEPQIVLVGRPNAGKSTLLNALAGEERAIVSPVAGTTRDAIWSHVRLRRGLVRIIDVAGIEDGLDEISRKMQQTAQRTIDAADIVVLVHDCAEGRPPPEREADLTVLTKLDLNPSRAATDSEHIAVSARTGRYLQALRDRLDEIAFGAALAGGGASLALNARHAEAMRASRDSLQRVLQALEGAGAEVIALELREALDALGMILGSVTPDDVLGRIFGSFCIGK